jgi:hypothetical protein
VTVKRSGREGRWADIPSARPRFAAEAAFLILVAAGAAIARLSPLAIVFLMLVAWVLVALIERAVSREQRAEERPLADLPEEIEAPPTPAALDEEPARTRLREAYRWLFWRRQREGVEPLSAPTAPLEERPSRSHVRRIEPEPEPPPPVEIEIEVIETEIVVVAPVAPGPSVTKRPLDLPGLEEAAPVSPAAEPPHERPAVRPAAEAPPPRVEAPIPPPEPKPPPPPPPDYRPAPPRPRPPAREWNLWELERRAREEAGDAERDEEWTALFLHLRQFADTQGVLPKEFDDLVRESFAELIQAA